MKCVQTIAAALLAILLMPCPPCRAGTNFVYSWNPASAAPQRAVLYVPPPAGYRRIPVAEGSFGEWLRHLPLRPVGTPVRLHNGTLKGSQGSHHAVLDIDTGSRDLQQCADAIIRLRAEYLYATGRTNAIHFNFTSGDLAAFARWAAGERPRITGNKVTWRKDAAPDDGYANFRAYLDTVFTYAGTASLQKELIARDTLAEVQPGDVFIDGGFPGHAVLVLDVARHEETGELLVLLAQSYMPAQDIHILRNLVRTDLSPWFPLQEGATLRTPDWSFHAPIARYFAEETAP